MPEETPKVTPEEVGRVRLEHAVGALVLKYLRAYMPHEIDPVGNKLGRGEEQMPVFRENEQMSRQIIAILEQAEREDLARQEAIEKGTAPKPTAKPITRGWKASTSGYTYDPQREGWGAPKTAKPKPAPEIMTPERARQWIAGWVRHIEENVIAAKHISLDRYPLLKAVYNILKACDSGEPLKKPCEIPRDVGSTLSWETGAVVYGECKMGFMTTGRMMEDILAVARLLGAVIDYRLPKVVDDEVEMGTQYSKPLLELAMSRLTSTPGYRDLEKLPEQVQALVSRALTGLYIDRTENAFATAV